MKSNIKRILKYFGYRISKIQPENIEISNAFDDMERFLGNNSKPTIFDIGANTGQSVNQFLKYFPDSEIFSFEPNDAAFGVLQKSNMNKKNVYLENCAIGSKIEALAFTENESSDMSSFLELSRVGWGKIKNKKIINTETVDNYCKRNNIQQIDVLKSDTQGFELEVLKGAAEMMKLNKIHLVYFEFIFSDMYKELPSFDLIYKLLHDNNFKLVKFYDFNYQENLLSWADFLFINSKYLKDFKINISN
jgi:FkbM family methyltransferase